MNIDKKIFFHETMIEGSKLEMTIAHANEEWGKIKTLLAENKVHRERIKELNVTKNRLEKINQIISKI